MTDVNVLGRAIQSRYSAWISMADIAFGELTLHVKKEYLISLCQSLRDEAEFDFKLLIDVCGVDYLGREPRFDVVYHLLSLVRNWRLRIKVQVEEGMPVPSVTSVYNSANWWEREVFDLYGIPFDDHPDLRRILTDYGFEGHPMRKDFPLTGYVEVRYDEEAKRVLYEPVKLPQAFRTFDFESPWEAMGTAVKASVTKEKR